MKIVLFIFFLLLGSWATLYSQKSENVNFKLLHKNFGLVNARDGDLHYDFIFQNTTDKVVKIKNVSATCGCTIPRWSNKEIPPGEFGKVGVQIKVSKVSGYFSKKITVITTACEDPTELQVTGRMMKNYRYNDSFKNKKGHLLADKEKLVFTVARPNTEKDIKFINMRRDTLKLEITEVPEKLRLKLHTYKIIPPGKNSRMVFTLKEDFGEEQKQEVKCYTVNKNTLDTLYFSVPIFWGTAL